MKLVFLSIKSFLKIYLTHFLFRTKALVLELLAAVCLVRGGHEIILSAFDNFKTVNKTTTGATHSKHKTTSNPFLIYPLCASCCLGVSVRIHEKEKVTNETGVPQSWNHQTMKGGGRF